MVSNKILKIDIIAGARPNFIKIAPLMHEFKNNQKFKARLIHTGQHYDKIMSEDFFKQLEISDPDINFSVCSNSQAKQTAEIMIAYESYLNKTYKPDLCIVVGDVTSTIACSIVAKKEKIKVAHIEAGLRSGDIAMPEEINRILTDSITDYFFTTSRNANKNLLKEGQSKERIYFVGNIMIDTLKKFENKFRKPNIWNKHNLSRKDYYILTLHRPSNVDDKDKFYNILSVIEKNIHLENIIYPIHPRVSNKYKNFEYDFSNIKIIKPLPYLEFNYLIKNAKAVITDSGGITEETTVFGVPCITLRKNTERPETVEIGTNELIKNFPKDFEDAIRKIENNQWKQGTIPEKWDGKTSKRILNHVSEILSYNKNLE
jgi:UDP-N-acetylglucosamine 2-epimerase (non-hydrolysing)